MLLDDPFPIESFPARVKEAILLEFNRRRPTVRKVANVSDISWLQLPGIGLRTLVELRYISGKLPGKKSPFARLTDAELITKCNHLPKEFGNGRRRFAACGIASIAYTTSLMRSQLSSDYGRLLLSRGRQAHRTLDRLLMMLGYYNRGAASRTGLVRVLSCLRLPPLALISQRTSSSCTARGCYGSGLRS